MDTDLKTLRRAAFEYGGSSLTEWGHLIEEFDWSVHYGDSFAFSFDECCYTEELLRKIRLISLASFETSEGFTAALRTEVIVPLLGNCPTGESFALNCRAGDWLQSYAAIPLEEQNGGEAGLVSLRCLIEKQSTKRLNALLHQAFDLVALFHDIYYLDCEEAFLEPDRLVPTEFAGLFERYSAQSTAWVKFAMAYVLVDLLEGRETLLGDDMRSCIQNIFDDYRATLARWTGKIIRDLKAL
jgi:hypothetical protein